MIQLPTIMVAPNGARRSRSDHPALPVTIAQTVADARACFDAGAEAIHAHVCDANGLHTLDAGLYRELIQEISAAVPQMVVQITTEAVGRYTSHQQMELVRELVPHQVSIAMREITADQEDEDLAGFFKWSVQAGVNIQHILYSPQEVQQFELLVSKGVVPVEGLETILVLGQYGGKRDSQPDDLAAYRQQFSGALATAGWAVCAFGRNETACLVNAVKQGGKARIGFENNLHDSDGGLSASNAARVAELVSALEQSGPLSGDVEQGSRPKP